MLCVCYNPFYLDLDEGLLCIGLVMQGLLVKEAVFIIICHKHLS